ncbi:unnamed protein product [Amoebophrya sp. A25]|nr:unnamed protein product [Amoebophrya sp. A25]|eukprot:GSA25T00000030001.1
MVSIRFPGQTVERKLELPQWIPDLSDEQVLKIQNAKELQILFDELANKIEKLEDSNQQLKDFIREEREEQAAAQAETTAPTDSSATSFTASATAVEAASDLHSAEQNAILGTSRSTASTAESTPDISGAENLSERQEGEWTLLLDGTAAANNATTSGGNLLEDGREQEQHDQAPAALSVVNAPSGLSQEHFELVSAIFENNHILIQMKKRMDLLKTRIDKLTLSQGMAL